MGNSGEVEGMLNQKSVYLICEAAVPITLSVFCGLGSITFPRPYFLVDFFFFFFATLCTLGILVPPPGIKPTSLGVSLKLGALTIRPPENSSPALLSFNLLFAIRFNLLFASYTMIVSTIPHSEGNCDYWRSVNVKMHWKLSRTF